MVQQSDLIDIMKGIPWFLELNKKQLEKLAQISHIRIVEPGEMVFNEGDREDFLYIILDGEASVDFVVPTRGQVHIINAEPLDIVGWSSLTPVVRQRTASIHALQSLRLLAINGEGLRELCDEDHHLGYIIMRRIANVVASNLLTSRLQLMELIYHSSNEPVR